MSKPKSTLLDGFPWRQDQKIADESELCSTRRTTRQTSKGALFTICEYSGVSVAYSNNARTSLKRTRIDYSPEPRPVKQKPARRNSNGAAKQPARKPATRVPSVRTSPSVYQNSQKPKPGLVNSSEPKANRIHDNNVPPPVFFTPPSLFDDSVTDVDMDGFNIAADFDEAVFDALDDELDKEETEEDLETAMVIRGMYSTEESHPVLVFGKIAIEYDNFDFTRVIEEITSLTCFNKKHEDSLIPLLKLVDRDVTKKLNTVTIKNFYKNEIIPAFENMKLFRNDPKRFLDKNKGQFERYVDGDCIVEVPLPPWPQIFPYQMRNIFKAELAEKLERESEQRFQEEDKLRAEIERLRQQRERRDMEQQFARNQQMFHAFMVSETNNNFHNPFNAMFNLQPMYPPNYYGHMPHYP
ncbi:hypothetical protein L3Y34_005000 [Caenorhabditis briggsae]|nr:hypothetical protein L3Y34_005000 [Caenorhabditis briggsae]